MKTIKVVLLSFVTIISIFTSTAQQGWKPQTNPLGKDTLLGLVQFINPNEGWINTGNGGYLHTTNGGAVWTKHYPFPSDTLFSSSDAAMGMSWVNSTHGWKLCSRGTEMNNSKGVVVLSTTNGGLNWTKKSVDDSGMVGLQIQFVNERIGWFTMFSFTKGIRFMKTTDGGANWVQLSSNAVTTFAFTDSIHGWAVTTWKNDTASSVPVNWSIEKTNDGGVNWIRQYTDGQKNVQILCFLNPINSTTCWVEAPNNKLLKTTNGGTTWDSIPFPVHYGLDSKFKFYYFIDANTGWITEDPEQNQLPCVVHHTTNGGLSWEVQNSTVSDGSIFSLYFTDANNGWLVGEQCYNCNDSSHINDVGVIRATKNGGTGLFKPSAFESAITVYPNPSTGSVNIESKKEINRVEVFNMLGEKIYTSRLGIALKQINMTGQREGMYIFRIYTRDAVTIQKVLLN